MGRIAATARPMATVPTDAGLLLDPATDLWADWGLLGVPDPDRITTTVKRHPLLVLWRHENWST